MVTTAWAPYSPRYCHGPMPALPAAATNAATKMAPSFEISWPLDGALSTLNSFQSGRGNDPFFLKLN